MNHRHGAHAIQVMLSSHILMAGLQRLMSESSSTHHLPSDLHLLSGICGINYEPNLNSHTKSDAFRGKLCSKFIAEMKL